MSTGHAPPARSSSPAAERMRLHRKRRREGMQYVPLGAAPAPPLTPLLTCPEPTYEGMIKLFATGFPSLGIFAAEGGQFIGGHSMSDDAKLRTASGLSAAWDGEPFKRVRSGEGITILPGRRLAMHLMAQPDVASMMLNDPLLAEQGILSRILPTAPESTSGHRPWHEPSVESELAMKRYGARLLDILELPLPLLTDRQSTLVPRALPLSAEARHLWIGFYDHVERRVASVDWCADRAFCDSLMTHRPR